MQVGKSFSRIALRVAKLFRNANSTLLLTNGSLLICLTNYIQRRHIETSLEQVVLRFN